MVQNAPASRSPSPPASSTEELPPIEQLLQEEFDKLRKQFPEKYGDAPTNNEDTDEDTIMTVEDTTTKPDDEKNDAEKKADEKKAPVPIPRLGKNISAAIFVPIPEANGLLQPLDYAPGSLTYHRAALDVVTRHEAAVRDNIEALLQREMLRINIKFEAKDPAFDYFAATASVQKEQQAALRQDMQDMIANMREPADSSVNYSNTTDTDTPPDMEVPVTYVPIQSPREFAAKAAMRAIAEVTQHTADFDTRARAMREAIEKRIQREEAALQTGIKQADRMDIV